MTTYEFTLVIEGDLDDEALMMRLFDNGCDDATFGVTNGVGVADFARDADSMLGAVMSAIADLQREGLSVRRLEPDELVTVPEIAERLGRSAESVRLLANGERGGGMFPVPISHMTTRHRLWRWSDVAQWAGMLDDEARRNADVLAAINAVLELNVIAERDYDLVKHLVHNGLAA